MFNIDNWGCEVANAKSTLGGICYYRYFNENNNDITTSGYFPTILRLKTGDRIWVIPKTTDLTDELYVVTNVVAGVPTVAKASGSSIDLQNVIETTTELPTAESKELGKVYMYIGATDGNMVHGKFYELVATQTASAVAFTGDIVSSWDVADFVLYMKEGGERYNEITHGTVTYDGSIWVLKGYDRNNVQVMTLKEYTEDMQDFGCVFASDTHTEGDNFSFTLTTEISGQKWEQMTE